MSYEPDSYEPAALRQEIHAWQEREFVVFRGVVAFVTAINVVLIGAPKEVRDVIDWRLIACVFYLVLISATLLTCLFGRYSIKIATYLWVVEHSQWEKAHDRFFRHVRKSKGLFNRILGFGHNRVLGLLYGGIGCVSIFIASISFTQPTKSTSNNVFLWVVFCLLTLFFLWTIYKLCFDSYPVRSYVETWRKVVEELGAEKIYRRDNSLPADKVDNR